MSIDKKISLLIEKKQKIDDEIKQLKLQNVETLANALAKISEIERLDTALVLGAVLQSVKDISDATENQQEVLRNSGKSFLKRFKIPSTKNSKSEK